MVIGMKVSLRMINNMVKEFTYKLMVTDMMVSLKMVILMVKEY